MIELRYDGTYNGALLRDELTAALNVTVDDVRLSVHASSVSVYLADEPTTEQQTIIDATITAHDPTQLTDAQTAAQQGVDARTQAQTLLAGIGALEPLDAGYVIVARSYAVADGEALGGGVVQGITDRASATDYVTSTAWWGTLTAAQRQMKALDLESEAVRTALLVAVLRTIT